MNKFIKVGLLLMCAAFLIPSVASATEANQEVINEVELEVEIDGDLWVEKDISNYYLLDEENAPVAKPRASGVVTKHYSVAWFNTYGQSNIGADQHI